MPGLVRGGNNNEAWCEGSRADFGDGHLDQRACGERAGSALRAFDVITVVAGNTVELELYRGRAFGGRVEAENRLRLAWSCTVATASCGDDRSKCKGSDPHSAV